MTDDQKPDLKVVPPQPNSPETKEKWEYARQLYVMDFKSTYEIAEITGLAESTIRSHRDKEDWRTEREIRESLAKKAAESMKFLLDPNTEAKAIAEGNLRVILEIQGLMLARAKEKIILGDPQLGLVDLIQKFSGALEKVVNAQNKLKNDGIEKSEVVHVHQIDMDQALQLALDARKKGKTITIGDAANAIAEQQKKVKDDGKSN